MFEPDWQRQQELEELEALSKQGERGRRKAGQKFWHRLQSDDVELDERQPIFGRGFYGMWDALVAGQDVGDVGAQIFAALGPIVLLAIIAFTVRFCAAGQHTQQVRQHQNTYQAP